MLDGFNKRRDPLLELRLFTLDALGVSLKLLHRLVLKLDRTRDENLEPLFIRAEAARNAEEVLLDRLGWEVRSIAPVSTVIGDSRADVVGIPWDPRIVRIYQYLSVEALVSGVPRCPK